ncbi:MAG: hypothetical protein N4A38_00325 [Candidatus Gracilibacteria bacterium]|nr:hypothetical protein [Candidatus Gracilibacteria bacterium]
MIAKSPRFVGDGNKLPELGTNGDNTIKEPGVCDAVEEIRKQVFSGYELGEIKKDAAYYRQLGIVLQVTGI